MGVTLEPLLRSTALYRVRAASGGGGLALALGRFFGRDREGAPLVAGLPGGGAGLFIRKHDHYTPARKMRRDGRALTARNQPEGRRPGGGVRGMRGGPRESW